jgi:hypothetical protein
LPLSSTTKVGSLLSSTNNASSAVQVCGGSNTNLCDLNFFIKTIERDLSDKFQKISGLNSGQITTPKSLVKNVEEQMRALGIDLANSKKIAAAVASGALRKESPIDV